MAASASCTDPLRAEKSTLTVCAYISATGERLRSTGSNGTGPCQLTLPVVLPDVFRSGPAEARNSTAVGHRERLEEEVGEAVCGPRLTVNIQAFDLVLTRHLAFVEETHGLVAQGTSILNSEGKNLMMTHVPEHSMLGRLRSSGSGERVDRGAVSGTIREKTGTSGLVTRSISGTRWWDMWCTSAFGGVNRP